MQNTYNPNSAHTKFWLSPDESLHDRKTIAAGICHSVRWIELLEKAGIGPPTLRIGHKKLTKKIDALNWFNQLANQRT
jgi:hypothetical protein